MPGPVYAEQGKFVEESQTLLQETQVCGRTEVPHVSLRRDVVEQPLTEHVVIIMEVPLNEDLAEITYRDPRHFEPDTCPK